MSSSLVSSLMPSVSKTPVQVSEMMRRMTRAMEHSNFVDGLEDVLREHCDVRGPRGWNVMPGFVFVVSLRT